MAQPAFAASRPLAPGPRYTAADRARAIRRGLRFLDRVTKVPENLATYGDDFLWCFYSLSATATDPWLRREAAAIGRERARQWRRANPRVPPDADADAVAALVSGSHSADCLGVRDDAMKPALVEAARRFGPLDYFYFDPATGVIPDHVPQACEACNATNSRAALKCAACATPARRFTRYELFTDALITTFSGDRYGVRLGASLSEVTALLAHLRPHRGAEGGRNGDFIDIAYAITHLVYALNDYGRYRLRPEWFPDEFAYLKENLAYLIERDDPETMGEFIDTLKAFGMTERDPLIRSGMAFILSRQHADGSWGERDDDAYTPYHATWTAINGLMDYAFSAEGSIFPEALRRARGT